jgi:hydroxyacylglutathione hydrolase
MAKKIVSGVYAFLDSQGSNVYLLKGTQKNILIDAGLCADSDYLTKELSTLNLSPNDIHYVLHTHGHADHIGGNTIFEKSGKFMHFFDGKKVNMKDPEFTFSFAFNQNYYPRIKHFFLKEQTIIFEPFSIKVLFTPGHTMGSVCFLEKNNRLLFSGDTIFNGSIGRSDLISSDSLLLKNSITRLSELDFRVLLPGHNEILEGNQKKNFKTAVSLFE